MRYREWIFLLLLAGAGIALANFVGFKVGFMESLPGVAILLVVSLCAAFLSKVVPCRLPIVAYCSILGLLIASPISPINTFVINAVNKIQFTTPLTMVGAFAGLSMSNQIKNFAQQGWKMIIVAILVMTGTFLGSAIISQMVDSSLPESICDTADEVIEKNNSLYENWNGKGLIQVYYSIRSLMSANEELILKVSQEAKKRDAMLEAHMNEYDKEVENVIEKTGLPPYEYLEKLGVLNSDFIGAHSLILSEGEKEIIKKHDIKIVQCPFSNSGKALANTPQLIKNGIKIGLGSDGVAHGGLSLWDEMKTLRCMMNVTWGIQENNRSIMPAKTLLKMAMENGKYFLRKNIGTIKEGYLADLIFIDLNQPHLWYSGNYTNTIFECVNKGDIIHSMVDGKWIMRDRKITTIDESSVREELKKWLSL